MSPDAVRTVTQEGGADLESFRRTCRSLWAEQVEPGQVRWQTSGDGAESTEAGVAPDATAAATTSPPLHVPASFMPLCESVILHGDAGRFDLLYRLLWRLQTEPALRTDMLDADWAKARQMASEVQQDLVKAAKGGEAPHSLAALRVALERCRECPIGEHATRAVPGEGPRRARLMFVGEQPGDQEDLRGRPFVGPAGQLLGRALAELGIDRRAVYISNAVKHFKFGLRGKRRIHMTPAQEEATACLHWLETEIALVDPEALIALGATAARQLMGHAVAVTRTRGQWLKRDDGRRVLVTLHPSALLRMEPEDKNDAYTAWLSDLRQAVRP